MRWPTLGARVSVASLMVLGVLTLTWGSLAAQELASEPEADQPAMPAESSVGAPTDSGIEGVVLLGPGCPGPIRLGSPCPDRPYPTTLEVFDDQGHHVADVPTHQDGTFRIMLPPGTYVVRARGREFRGPPRSTEQTATVAPGLFTTVPFRLDSGMR